MSIPVVRERLARTFIRLCEIDSPSRHEGEVAAYLHGKLMGLGAEVIIEDRSAMETGSEVGNMIVRFQARESSGPPIFFVCHMDTVQPGCGVRVRREGDLFSSQGETILGGDDKSGIAALLEALQLIAESGVAHRTVELILTTCEEIGLLGAKALEVHHLQAEFGYALDSSGIDRVIVGAPAANGLEITIQGLAAHAGLNPEDGISAIGLAAEAIVRLPLGRIDEQSTANLGLIQGGVATNIVPEQVVIRGEVRSHSEKKLAQHTENIQQIFERIVAYNPVKQKNGGERPTVEMKVVQEYPSMALAGSDPVVTLVRQAGKRLDRELEFLVAGGGSDANILNSYDLPTAIIATGMTNVHTTEESQDLNDLVSLTELLFELMTG